MQKLSNTIGNFFFRFADDSTIFCDDPNALQLINNVNAELINVGNRLNSNKLSLDLLKTKYMTSHNQIPFNEVIQMRNNEISNTKTKRQRHLL